MSTAYGIQGQLLDVTVVGCSKLKDTEWISRQDPYVCLEYATTKFRTRTCTDGGKHPVFQEKTVIPLIEGLREISVSVWNSNTMTFDDFIGSGRVQLQKVLSQGYDDSAWPLQSKSGKYAGDVKLIMHFQNYQKPQKSTSSYAPYAPMHMGAAPPYAPPPHYAPPKSVSAGPSYPPPVETYAASPYPAAAYPPVSSYPPPVEAYPASPYPAAANPSAMPATPYPAAAYPPAQTAASYPPSAYPPPMQQTYPPSPYPPQAYPPPQAQPFYPPEPYAGVYPPPPY